MAITNDELLTLTNETKDLSNYIADLKRKRNRSEDESEKESLTEEIKMRQFQVLFYLEKMENASKV